MNADANLVATRARKHLEALEAEQNKKLDDLQAELDKARARGAPEKVIEDLQNKLSHQQRLSKRYIVQAEEKVKEAEGIESQQAQFAETARLNKEQAKKELALKHWQKAGGSAADFETAWPEMNREMLQNEVVAKLTTPPVADPRILS